MDSEAARAPSSIPVAGGAARPHRQSEGLTWLVSVLQEVSAPHTQSRHTPSAMTQGKPPRYRFSWCPHVHDLKSKHPLPPSFYYLSHLLTQPLKSLKTPQREETPRGKLAPYQGNESSSHIFVMATQPSTLGDFSQLQCYLASVILDSPRGSHLKYSPGGFPVKGY